MTRGYWDRDGFHEGPMPATDFTPRRAPIADRKPESADNLGQPVTGVPRGGCNSPTQASRQSFDEYVDNGQPIQLADSHPDRRNAAWIELELGGVPTSGRAKPLFKADPLFLGDKPVDVLADATTVGDAQGRRYKPATRSFTPVPGRGFNQ